MPQTANATVKPRAVVVTRDERARESLWDLYRFRAGPDFDPPPCGKDGQDRPFVSNNLNDAGVDQPKGHVVQQTRSLRESLPNPRIIRQMIQQRQVRSQFFASGFFANPAWDMLLDLAVAAKEYRQVSVTSLSIASCTPPTTTLRWIDVLIEEGLVDRVEDPTDRTLVFVKLTDEGLMALASYFRNLRSFAKWLVLDRP